MTTPAERIHITFRGNARDAMIVAKTFEAAGLKARTDGRYIENRSGQQVAQWIGMYVVGAIVDETAGAPVRTAIRAMVAAVIADLKQRFPHITIHIED